MYVSEEYILSENYVSSADKINNEHKKLCEEKHIPYRPQFVQRYVIKERIKGSNGNNGWCAAGEYLIDLETAKRMLRNKRLFFPNYQWKLEEAGIKPITY